MSHSTEYAKQVMEDLDALLADLQSTTAHISYSNQGPPLARGTVQPSAKPSYLVAPNPGGRTNNTPSPLPPPPQDLPDTIPPPQQFDDQPLYEPQNVRRDLNNRLSSSSRSSQGSQGEIPYHSRDQYSQNTQYQQRPGSRSSQGSGSGEGSYYGREPSQHYQQQQQQFQHYTPQQQQHNHQDQTGMSMISNNLSELDQLLSDLNSAQFMAEVDKKHAQIGGKQPPPAVAPKPSRGGGNISVDSLLDQLEVSAPTGNQGQIKPAYNGTQNQHHVGQPGGHVQVGQPGGHVQQNTYAEAQQGVQSTSAATQELDDLMATLSDFKMKDKVAGSQVRRSPSPGSEPSYAKPQKSRNLSQSSSNNSSTQGSQITSNLSGGSNQGGQLESMLGDLQSDLSKQGVNTKTKGLCAACNQPVVGQVITALGKIWHIEHFACAHCHETLGTKNFYERDGVAYCEMDYHSLFAPRCGYCNGPIIDKCVTALNQTWHPEHFFCAQCGRPFGEDGFHERDGKAFCKIDFFELFAPKCGGCNRAIKDNYISGLNRHWHPECFACWECHQPFGGGSFFDHEGLPYCETHYHQKRGSLCAACQKPITGRCITAMSKKFHPEHFVCAFCLKQLNKGTFKEQNDRPYCHPCFVKLFG
ncbi:paxillin-like isoform X1 [Dreissena polymorpha]|uniref:paxillin-like isoform X1 n=2 Tax=Dreissena polymorpha TaxID=45954 RepID=UPI0022649C44|nr:paxillin-like isoform X1 [Dreissena polymorpha]